MSPAALRRKKQSIVPSACGKASAGAFFAFRKAAFCVAKCRFIRYNEATHYIRKEPYR